MPRIPKGVTLTEEEKAQAGYTPGARASSSNADPTPHEHSCTVTLPDGRHCQVNYRRYCAHSHEFSYREPLCQTVYLGSLLGGSLAAIEAKAQELLATAYRKAQEAERKQMRQKSLSKATSAKRTDNGPAMSTKNAEQMAGKYAPCMRNKSGVLIRIGRTWDTAEQAAAEIASGKFKSYRLSDGQALVVGICNRQAQCWQEPQFLAAARPAEDGQDHDQDSEEDVEHQLPGEDELE